VNTDRVGAAKNGKPETPRKIGIIKFQTDECHIHKSQTRAYPMTLRKEPKRIIVSSLTFLALKKETINIFKKMIICTKRTQQR
jgi:hypothetical protein